MNARGLGFGASRGTLIPISDSIAGPGLRFYSLGFVSSTKDKTLARWDFATTLALHEFWGSSKFILREL